MIIKFELLFRITVLKHFELFGVEKLIDQIPTF